VVITVLVLVIVWMVIFDEGTNSGGMNTARTATATFVGQYNFDLKMKMYVRSGDVATANTLRK